MTGMWDATSGGTQIQSVSLTQSGGVPTNQITSVTTSGTLNHTYDAAGNVTNDGVNTWVYDAENRIVSRNSGTDQFQYDHANRRIKKTSSASGAAIHYVWQGSQVIAEHNSSSGAVIVDYIYADGRMIAKEESGRSFVLNDRLSVRAVITDGQGGIQGRQAHLPFGEQFGTSGQQDKHAFTSYEKDTESGTEYAMNRQYSSVVGRFQQADPYEPSSHLVDPQSWNRYAYTRNNAINRIDPFGCTIKGLVKKISLFPGLSQSRLTVRSEKSVLVEALVGPATRSR